MELTGPSTRAIQTEPLTLLLPQALQGGGTNNIQDGPDGFAVSDGVNIDFISYGGSFAATDGLAVGLTSEDVGITEPNTGSFTSTLRCTTSCLAQKNHTQAISG